MLIVSKFQIIAGPINWSVSSMLVNNPEMLVTLIIVFSEIYLYCHLLSSLLNLTLVDTKFVLFKEMHDLQIYFNIFSLLKYFFLITL